MIYLTGRMGGATRRAALHTHLDLGLLMSPESWQTPFCRYALDNDVFAHSPIGSRPDPGWWPREGWANWLRMLDKAAASEVAPMWVLLPDVVGDWAATIERGHRYRAEVEARGLRCALALQDGLRAQDALDFAPHAVFVGGTTRWKWAVAPAVVEIFGAFGIWTHLGRCNGETRIRQARKMGFDSADGTGLARHFNAVLPQVLRGLREESPQHALF